MAPITTIRIAMTLARGGQLDEEFRDHGQLSAAVRSAAAAGCGSTLWPTTARSRPETMTRDGIL